ncbi:hypothetical protein [Actinoalloteichus caeruleus]|uniref:Uncharacterized protein n=1 Tax=Actinoalloteichus caeruleus DSM 43889 TaxID=1120930 RepID=A0ABT1JDW8_ACTCY|nr:hypothetical protein [Actinoalloteichus caeruleus]MCP2330695.1 hypothetical protein [Actinoalloteichus caeruleus DSM 43889]
MSHSNTAMDPDEVRNAAAALKNLLPNFDEMMSELLSIEIRPGNLAAGHFLEDVVGNRKEELRQHLLDLKKVVTYIGDNLEEIAGLFEDVDETNAAELARVTSQIDGLVSDMALQPPEPVPGDPEYMPSDYPYPGQQHGYAPPPSQYTPANSGYPGQDPTYQAPNGGYVGQPLTYESQNVPANYQYGTQQPTYPSQHGGYPAQPVTYESQSIPANYGYPVNHGYPATPALPVMPVIPVTPVIPAIPLEPAYAPVEPMNAPMLPVERAYTPLEPMNAPALPVERGLTPLEPRFIPAEPAIPAERLDHDA